ncbi:DNA polymerase I, partial [Bordetella hinzii]|nr:DNA polymerase I [Bordetella hinzii]
WLSEFGSIDRLVEHADTIKGVAGNNLREAVARFPLTRQLLTVKDDCDLGAFLSSPEDLKPREPDRETLGALYDRYGFRTWLRELSGDAERVPTGDARAAEVAHEAPAEQHYQIITEWTDLEAWMARVDAASLVALDTETTSLDEMQARLVGISMAVEPGVACYIPLAHRGPEAGTQLPRHEV